ncbi:hypothetical protein FRC06_000120 [Ceratobasidium sp. 370]|nr:hypothetical protein FRC06_000120 [Ceratobasidium sp. 370]
MSVSGHPKKTADATNLPANNHHQNLEPRVGAWQAVSLDNAVRGPPDQPALGHAFDDGQDYFPAFPVTDQFLNLPPSQPSSLKLENNCHNPLTPLDVHTADGYRVYGAGAQPFRPVFINADSDNDATMPDVADLIRSKPPMSMPLLDSKKNPPPKPSAAPPGPLGDSTKSSRAPKPPGRKAGGDAPTSNTWTVPDMNRLIKHASEHVFNNKRTPKALRLKWEEMKAIYYQIDVLESFTGGDGDDDWQAARISEDDDPEEIILEKLHERLDIVRERKPGFDPHSKVKTAEIYWDWVRGGNEGWYKRMHARFKGSLAYDRKHTRRIVYAPPLEGDSDSDDDTSSEADSNLVMSGFNAKSRANKTKHARSTSALEAVASTTKEFLSAGRKATESGNAVALQRLSFDREQASVAHEIARETMRMLVENQKRKWSNDRRMAELEEERRKRRWMMEETTAHEERLLNRVRELNKLVADPATDSMLKDLYRERIESALRQLSQVGAQAYWTDRKHKTQSTVWDEDEN